MSGRAGGGLPLAACIAGLVACGAILVWRGEEPGGIEEVWSLVLGPPDLGPVDFANLDRSATSADALACPSDLCRAGTADIPSPVYPVPGERLRAIVAEVAREDPRTDLVFQARWAEEDRYVARTRTLRLPDTINVAILGAGQGASTFALYSRSQIGALDFGANRARVERWLGRIGERARS